MWKMCRCWCYSLANGDSDPDPGIIMYDVDGTKQTIPYSSKAIMDGFCPPKYGDLVSLYRFIFSVTADNSRPTFSHFKLTKNLFKIVYKMII